MTGTRQCARPGCAGPVAARLSYDYAGQRIWLDDPGVELAGHHSGLCAVHAGRLRPPVGWSCLDRRTGRPPSREPAAQEAQPAAPAAAGPGDDAAGMAVIAV